MNSGLLLNIKINELGWFRLDKWKVTAAGVEEMPKSTFLPDQLLAVFRYSKINEAYISIGHWKGSYV